MNNYCRNCGEKLEKNARNCPKCNTEVFETRINVEETKKKNEELKQKENMYLSVMICIIIAIYLIEFFDKENTYDMFVNFLGFVSIVILITGRVKLKESKKVRTIFNFFLVYEIVSIVLYILAMVACVGAFAGLGALMAGCE